MASTLIKVQKCRRKNDFERNDVKTVKERLALHEERLQVDKNRM